MYQPYYKIMFEKLNCIPNSLVCSDDQFCVDSADAVFLTVQRRLDTLQLSDYFEAESDNVLKISIKIGFDGSESRSSYDRFFLNQNSSDKHFIVAFFVLLDILHGQKKNVSK